jgi:hypothetical protein
MIAYALLNDLLGGDEPFPRDGCRALSHAWLRTMPGVLPDIDAALARAPTVDDAFVARVASAWDSLVNKKPTSDAASLLTQDTVRRVGAHPAITVVYRDAGLEGDGVGAIDVVRIGDTVRTYVMISEDDFSPTVLADSRSPICTVGDGRCGSYYDWP